MCLIIPLQQARPQCPANPGAMCLASHSHLCLGRDRGLGGSQNQNQGGMWGELCIPLRDLLLQARLAAASPRWDIMQLTAALSSVNGGP